MANAIEGKDAVGTSDKHGLELRDNSADVVSQLRKRWENRLTLTNPRLVERYVSGELWMFVKVDVSNLDSLPEDFYAVLNGYGRALGTHLHDERGNEIANEHLDVRRNDIPHSESLNNAAHEDYPVLVYVVQAMQQPQIVVPSLIWFERVDQINRRLAHSLYWSTSHASYVYLGRSADRENGVAQIEAGPAMEGGKSASKMVERTPQILNHVPDNKWPILGDRPKNLGAIDTLVGLRVILEDEFIAAGFIKGFQPRAEITDVLFGPFDFRP